MSKQAEVQLDLYQLLGLTPSASQAEIKAAWKSSSQKLHPDKGGTPEHYAKVRKAFDLLHDPDRRFIYDLGVRQGFTHEEFYSQLKGLTGRLVEEICASLVKSSSFPPPNIKALATKHMVESKSEILDQRKKLSIIHKKLAEALAKVIKGQESLIIEGMISRERSVQGALTTCEVQLAVIEYMEENNKLIQVLEDPNRIFLGAPGFLGVTTSNHFV